MVILMSFLIFNFRRKAVSRKQGKKGQKKELYFFKKKLALPDGFCYYRSCVERNRSKSYGSLVKGLRRCPLTAESWVRFPYELRCKETGFDPVSLCVNKRFAPSVNGPFSKTKVLLAFWKNMCYCRSVVCSKICMVMFYIQCRMS